MNKYRLSEQVKQIVGGIATTQSLLVYVDQAFSAVVRNRLFADKRTGEGYGVDGSFIYSFDNQDVSLDSDKNMYYCTVPSTYVGLPSESGIHHVSLQQSQNSAFTRLPNGYYSLLNNLLVAGDARMQQSFFVENNRIYFPFMSIINDPEKVLIKLVCALDGIDTETEIAIPPDVQGEIIQYAVQLFQAKTRLQDAKKETE